MCYRIFADVGGKAITRILLLFCEYIVASRFNADYNETNEGTAAFINSV